MGEKIRDIDLLGMTIEQIGRIRIPVGDQETVRSIWEILGNLGALKEAMEERDRRTLEAAREEAERKALEAGGDADVPD